MQYRSSTPELHRFSHAKIRHFSQSTKLFPHFLLRFSTSSASLCKNHHKINHLSLIYHAIATIVAEQIEDVKGKKKQRTLKDLLLSGDTWEVK